MSSTNNDLEISIADLPAAKIAQINQLLRKTSIPSVIDDIKKLPAIKWREYDVHDYYGPETGAPYNKTWNEYIDNVHLKCYTRRGPASPYPCPLVETITNSSGITFTTGISGDASKKFGGSGKFGGSSYITIADDSILDVTDEISIIGWFFIPAGITSGDLVKKNNQYQLYISAANTISFRVYSGGAWKTAITLPFTSDTWTHIAATYKSAASGQKLYKNGALQSSDSETGAIATSSNALGIAHDGTGASILGSNSRLAWLSLLHDEMSLANVQAHYAGLLDTNTHSEIVTYPFSVNANYETDMHPGNFKPS